MNATNNLTRLYSNNNNPNIIGRGSEIRKLYLSLLRHEKPNVIITAEPGIGKTALIHQLAYLIANKLCPKELYGFKVIEISTNALLAGPGYRGVTEEKFQKLIDKSLQEGKVILFFDEFHTVEKLGQMANGQTPGLGNTLKPYLTRPDFRVIGATTNEEFKSIEDKALLRRFSILSLKEPSEEAIKAIAKSCLIKYGKGLKIDVTCINKAYELSLSLDGNNPDKIKDIIDITCASARLDEVEVTPKYLGHIFQEFFLNRNVKNEF